MSLINIQNDSLRDQIVGPTGAIGPQGILGPTGPTGPEGTIPATIAVDVINPLSNLYIEIDEPNGLRLGPDAVIASNNIPINSIDWNGANGLTADAIMNFDAGLTTDAITNNNMVDMEIVNADENMNFKVPVTKLFNFQVGGADKLEIDNTDTTIFTDLIVNTIEKRTTPDISIENINMRDNQICFSNGFCIDDELSTASTVTLQFAPNDMLCFDKLTNVMGFSVGGGPLNPDWTISNTVLETRVPIDTITSAVLQLGLTNATTINNIVPIKCDEIQELTGSNSVVMTNGIKLGAGTDILDIYDEDTQSNTLSGVWASAQNIDLKFTKIGRIVTMSWPSTLATSNASAIITVDTNIPAEFRPLGNSVSTSLKVLDDGSAFFGLMVIQASATSILIYKDVSASNFTGAGGSTGILGGSVTYNSS
jgi:hypothetical protein